MRTRGGRGTAREAPSRNSKKFIRLPLMSNHPSQQTFGRAKKRNRDISLVTEIWTGSQCHASLLPKDPHWRGYAALSLAGLSFQFSNGQVFAAEICSASRVAIAFF